MLCLLEPDHVTLPENFQHHGSPKFKCVQEAFHLPRSPSLSWLDFIFTTRTRLKVPFPTSRQRRCSLDMSMRQRPTVSFNSKSVKTHARPFVQASTSSASAAQSRMSYQLLSRLCPVRAFNWEMGKAFVETASWSNAQRHMRKLTSSRLSWGSSSFKRYLRTRETESASANYNCTWSPRRPFRIWQVHERQ